MFVCIYVDSCSHFLLWLAFLLIVVDFVCLRRNCTNGKRIFVYYALLLLCADLVYTLLFCFVFVCNFFPMLCFKVKCQRRSQHSVVVGIVVVL